MSRCHSRFIISVFTKYIPIPSATETGEDPSGETALGGVRLDLPLETETVADQGRSLRRALRQDCRIFLLNQDAGGTTDARS